MKLRVKFSKHGVLKFIGHLDVMRYFQKAIRRAGIDIVYSTGFSPHQIMSFAAPLGVGLESNGEYMDIEVNALTSSKELTDLLNAQMADGIEVLEVKLLPDNAGNAMASVAAARYTIAFREECQPSFLTKSVIDDFYSQSKIIVTKKTKKSESTFDMKPYIYMCDFDEENNTIDLTVDASSAGNIKPALVVKALFDYKNQVFDEFGLLITREETYTNVGTAEDVQLKPLGFVGSDY
ncbi:MAG: TIGR03936 family radical SAM-associated protein [Lachnospiraceae bacterium]|nr:TIGR03936 family radical SAM-associated protein [Lachnospiraceae bacterium]MDE7202969.1 TIGR03936 family radical SAM-associated protein [Lachnospiraceae bacterium]